MGKSIELGHRCWCGSDKLLAAPALIRSMSFRLAIPGGLLSSSARFRFANRRALSEQPSAQARSFYLDNRTAGA